MENVGAERMRKYKRLPDDEIPVDAPKRSMNVIVFLCCLTPVSAIQSSQFDQQMVLLQDGFLMFLYGGGKYHCPCPVRRWLFQHFGKLLLTTPPRRGRQTLFASINVGSCGTWKETVALENLMVKSLSD
uniref:Uncharacterized protein n=1 Tax=Sphaerodactylus townsendi TaxID=933632 RepID=A0ACB8EYJ2_9SAUR